MRIIHTADLHLGTTTYGTEDPSTGLNRRVQDFFAAFDQCVDYAIEKRADALLLCGDTFKDISPSSTLLKMFAIRLRRLTSEGVKVLMLLGNHDSPKTVGRAAPLEVFDELKLSGVHVFSRPDMVDLTSRDGVKFRVFTLPYRHPIHIAARFEKRSGKVELNMKELQAAFEAEIKSTIEGFAEMDRGDGRVGILAGHLLVEGARRGAERVYMVGAEFAVPLETLESEAFDFIALGHVHSHQILPGRVPAVYPGSLERIDFTEADEQKGFLDITHADGRLEWRFVPVQTRRMIRLNVDCTEAEDANKLAVDQIEKANVKDAIVRLVLRVKPERHVDLDPIHKKLEPAFWHQVGFERTEEKPIPARMDWQSLSPHETLARYVNAAKLSDEEKSLVKRLGNEIVEEVLSEAREA